MEGWDNKEHWRGSSGGVAQPLLDFVVITWVAGWVWEESALDREAWMALADEWFLELANREHPQEVCLQRIVGPGRVLGWLSVWSFGFASTWLDLAPWGKASTNFVSVHKGIWNQPPSRYVCEGAFLIIPTKMLPLGAWSISCPSRSNLFVVLVLLIVLGEYSGTGTREKHFVSPSHHSLSGPGALPVCLPSPGLRPELTAWLTPQGEIRWTPNSCHPRVSGQSSAHRDLSSASYVGCWSDFTTCQHACVDDSLGVPSTNVPWALPSCNLISAFICWDLECVA